MSSGIVIKALSAQDKRVTSFVEAYKIIPANLPPPREQR